MSEPRFSKEVLHRLPHNVQAKMDEVGLRNPLEKLIELSNSDQLQEDDQREFLFALMDHIIASLSYAMEPLAVQSFHDMNGHVSSLPQRVANQDWDSVQHITAALLRELAALPTSHPPHSIQSAKGLNRSMNAARRELGKTEGQLRAALESAEASFRESTDARSKALSDEASRILQEFSDMEEQASGRHAATVAEMKRLLEELEERYGFTSTQVLGGAHELAAKAEEEEAVRHDNISQWSMWTAVAIAAIAQVFWYAGWSPDWTEWFDPLRSLPLIGSPVVILLFVAKREGRVAAEHRARHERLQSLSLQFRSWEPYLNTLSEDVRAEMERQVTPRLFVGDAGLSGPSDS